ncbi:MAG: GNAT family N-acetyltransferase [Paracoccaceae bacterium]
MAIDLKRAVFPDDAAVLQRLFRGYLEFLFERAPEQRSAVESKYDPARIPQLVEDFARIHARPKGELLIAWLDGEAVGCAMMRELEPGIVEIQRVFVAPVARGLGLGKALTLALVEQARADGQSTMRLDTGAKLREAVGLYTSLGFRERSAYHNDTPALDDILCFFELQL